ncbi:MAG: squalene synthase HpnC [Zymomonas mobilis subsp. pomaceae]|uniref:Squalene synthase HpnC n=1 Tax=Zymomonas mobilis subsp. pomaceae (strain ATCC 29192 / DSM 22645 / JCM 10191 / CCUG 17912 / NBRC 13757 / NCIMB 11200 / NRRL B-4491 / Barker I) TaxID=579138 RepID=F8EV11_ZYMMT|nr:squalene synthase HpnC [Zymomonas mobilis]AEI37299.1 squalene synthase HpnC [Zymomonas mobilis subsp. pomaceae ATCC 29192]MDX5948668.1 squalene synthase HpnC [Zymomonas mobilis subsp. pomaceae]GEB88473.1 squalene synthase HpnC [Zymomonas mobilis subsp. pomaceae]
MRTKTKDRLEAVALASGKGHQDENFPVASFLINPKYRPVILAFYQFARHADDVADNATASKKDRLSILEEMRASLTGESQNDTDAVILRETLLNHHLEQASVHGLDLLEAFRRDVSINRYKDWDALIDYCRYSAAPVGRFVLDVHGESRNLWPMNDALCTALQIINHLQDCGKDYRMLNRVYIPTDIMEAVGASMGDLGRFHASLALQQAISTLALKTMQLLKRSAGFSEAIQDRRLGVEVAVIQRLAESLTKRLIKRDPLSERVHHNKAEAFGLAFIAAAGRVFS